MIKKYLSIATIFCLSLLSCSKKVNENDIKIPAQNVLIEPSIKMLKEVKVGVPVELQYTVKNLDPNNELKIANLTTVCNCVKNKELPKSIVPNGKDTILLTYTPQAGELGPIMRLFLLDLNTDQRLHELRVMGTVVQ